MTFNDLASPQTGGRFVMPAVRRGMQMITSVVGGPIDPSAYRALPGGSVALPDAQVIVHATSCSWPLLCPEAQDLAAASGFDALIVRTVPGLAVGTYLSSIDLLLHEYPHWLRGYRPWFGAGHDQGWLVPSGEGPAAHMSPKGLRISELLPFDSCAERDAGLIRASWVSAYFHWRV